MKKVFMVAQVAIEPIHFLRRQNWSGAVGGERAASRALAEPRRAARWVKVTSVAAGMTTGFVRAATVGPLKITRREAIFKAEENTCFKCGF